MTLKSDENEVKYLCEIEAEPIYLEAHSSPESDKYVFANSIRVSFISQLIDVETGLILFAEEINRESIESASSRDLEPDLIEKMTKDVLKQSFSDLKLLIQENGLTMKS